MPFAMYSGHNQMPAYETILYNLSDRIDQRVRYTGGGGTKTGLQR